MDEKERCLMDEKDRYSDRDRISRTGDQTLNFHSFKWT